MHINVKLAVMFYLAYVVCHTAALCLLIWAVAALSGTVGGVILYFLLLASGTMLRQCAKRALQTADYGQDA